MATPGLQCISGWKYLRGGKRQQALKYLKEYLKLKEKTKYGGGMSGVILACQTTYVTIKKGSKGIV